MDKQVQEQKVEQAQQQDIKEKQEVDTGQEANKDMQDAKLSPADEKLIDETEKDLSLEALEKVNKLEAQLREYQLKLKAEKLSRLLEREGCVDIDTAVKLANLEELDESKLEEFVKHFKASKPYFFRVAPAHQPAPLPVQKDVWQMSEEEFRRFWDALKNGRIRI